MDWNYIEIVGKGVYAGDTLVSHNTSNRWWGEGDEKIYVDGESFPSHFGTGTEDYYCYSRGGRDSAFFESPFLAHSQIEGDKSPGYSAMTRVRSLDAIPFSERLKMDMEIWHWEAVTMAYAATTYWYALPGATSIEALMKSKPLALSCQLLACLPKTDPLVVRTFGRHKDAWQRV